MEVCTGGRGNGDNKIKRNKKQNQKTERDVLHMRTTESHYQSYVLKCSPFVS